MKYLTERCTISPLIHLSRRSLKLFATPRTEVVIANNAGIFFTKACVDTHGKENHPDINLIIPPFWLDDIHADYSNLHWGQTIKGLPQFVRKEFLKIYPNHSENEFLRWGQFKELRLSIIEQLKQSGVSVFHGLPNIEKKTSGYDISVQNSHFFVPENTFFYNVFRFPNVNHSYAKLPKTAHVMLYTKPRKQVPKNIILLGSGESVLWVCKHFPDSMIAAVRKRGIKHDFPYGEALPKNLLVYENERIRSDDENEPIYPDQDFSMKLFGSEVAIVDHKKLGRNFVGDFYCAIGLIHNESVIQQVPEHHQLVYPYDNSNYKPWIAPEAALPVGSLIESTLRWAHVTGNLEWASETYCYHEPHFMTMMIARMQKKNVHLDTLFFDELRIQMMAAYQSITTTDHSQLSLLDKEVFKIYKSSYVKAYEKHPNLNSLDDFENCLREIFKRSVSTGELYFNIKGA